MRQYLVVLELHLLAAINKMTTTLTIIFFIFGLIIGSFLNVVIFRFNTGKSFKGRSMCLSCGHTLSWHELIPLFSFLFLKGRCKACKTKISLQYPIVEFISGFIFAFLFLKFKDVFFYNTTIFTISYAYYTTMFSMLLCVAVYDLKHKIIPDVFALFFGVLAFLGLFLFQNDLFYIHIPFVWDIFSGLIFALPFALLWLVSRGAWIGLGDAKIALGLGWMLGISRLLPGAVIAFWAGAIVGLLLILFSKKYNAKSEVPFAPFLFLGTLLVFLFELSIFIF